ncbi:MMPL family transporter [Hathewaya histolytica]|uniref:Antibiotic ABC transporter permease n=1 Tax=Hathewaya histolytica TaxID=1498 RepID=A0A4U9QWV0_HATHI|nr:MMPL family transporter [Hathewaya histolytica]VTQ82578.1 antibiotic ABC transporter permease [Hathewaya histolytica]
MKRFGEFIVKRRVLVILISLLLLIPSILGFIGTRINYDILSYLPQELDTMKGQKILDEEFSNASTGMLMVENMQSKDVVKLKEEIEKVKGVEKAIWISDAMDISVPKEMLPEKIRNMFYSKDTTLIMIKFKEGSASVNTFNAVDSIKKITGKRAFLGGMSAIIHDTRQLAEKETPFYVLIAVAFAIIVLMLTMESTVVPFIFLVGIGFPIAYNLGSNYFLGEISYITKALAAVLQLGVTMDYSIFLLHRYEEEKSKRENREEAMAEAIASTFTSIAGSSLTTIAGFLALCTMKLGLGKDIGIVMAKGVVLGVLSTVTTLPALLMFFDKAIHKYTHRTVMPGFKKVSNFVVKHNKALAVFFVVLFVPFIYAQNNTEVYYNLDEALPKDLDSIVATNKLKEDYKMTTTHFVITDKNIEPYKVKEMVGKIENIDGIENVLSYDSVMGASIPENFIPDEIKEVSKKGNYSLMMINSKYKAATKEENEQITKLNDIVKSYDKGAVIAGEGPLTKDLIDIADKDFKSVNVSSILAIFIIVLLVFSSLSIPVILVLAIELAISINLGLPYFTGTIVPFVASIVIGTIQLGATVDYAILMTSRFKEELNNGLNKYEAIKIAIEESSKSIVTSALTFFGATIGVYAVSKMELIKSLCLLMARGAIISMFSIIIMLPPLLIIFEKVISKTTRKWRDTSMESNQQSSL